MLCLELTSLHVQPSTETGAAARRRRGPAADGGHALFSDAAAAVVLEPDAAGRRRGGAWPWSTGRAHRRLHADHMTWDVTDLGFKMGLSPAVTDVLARHAQPVVGSC
jgi:predicted naringenin-chalcone synthase